MRIGVTGHRPNKLPGGYDLGSPANSLLRLWLVERLLECQKACASTGSLDSPPEHLTAITGMAIGADQIFAVACIEVGVPFIAAVPCRGQETRWPESSRRFYNGLLEKAAEVKFVHDGPYTATCMLDRNTYMVQWLASASNKALLAVWDGVESGGTWDTVRKARSYAVPICQYEVVH